jgi:hypothetical protein
LQSIFIAFYLDQSVAIIERTRCIAAFIIEFSLDCGLLGKVGCPKPLIFHEIMSMRILPCLYDFLL